MKVKRLKFTSLFLIAALILSSQTALAAGPSPFVGHWEAVDIDGSDIRLAIGGPPSGPFQITWTESHISFCDGEAGILRGTGVFDPEDPNLLEADLFLECFTTGASTEFHLTFRFHAATEVLSTVYPGGLRVIFTRPGHPKESPPQLELRTNYQENWVEGFYPEGYTVWITVTEADGRTIKATAEVVTGPVPFWDGEIGFATEPEDWDPEQPDIEPNDWVYGWVDNGASGQMRVGEIFPAVDLEANLVQGNITAPWYAEEVFVICNVWGYDEWLPAGLIMPNGIDYFSCDFDGLWDIVEGDTAEVWYFGPDGHAVGHYIHIPNPHVIAFPEYENIFGYEWPLGSEVHLTINGPENFTMMATVGPAPWDENDIMAFFDFNGLYDLIADDIVTLSGSGLERTYVVEPLAVTTLDAIENTISGTADPGAEIFIGVFGYDLPEILVTVDNGTWTMDFDDIPFDLETGMCGRAEIPDDQRNSTAVDWCIPNPEIRAWLGNPRVEGYGWPAGKTIMLEIAHPEGGEPFTASALVEDHDGWTFVGFSTEGWDLEPGQEITMYGDGLIKTHIILPVSITNADPDLELVEGTASAEGRILLCVYEGGCDPPAEIFADSSGNWSFDYSGQLDLFAGLGLDATEFDQDGDGTSFDYWIPVPPRIAAYPEQGFVIGWDWPHDAFVTMTVDKPGTGPGVDYSATTQVVVTPFSSEMWWAMFDFGGAFDLEVGDIVILTDGFSNKEHTVLPLTVEVLDEAMNTVGGTSAPEAWLFVHPWEVTFDPVQADSSGNWVMDFTGLYDLQQGTNGIAEVFDQDDDSTAIDWQVPPGPEVGLWAAAYTFDLVPGTLGQGVYPYHFEFIWTVPQAGDFSGQEGQFEISPDADLYEGFVLLRGPLMVRGIDTAEGLICENIEGSLHPDQALRFLVGWLPDYGEMTFDDAVEHFDSISSATVIYGEGSIGGLEGHEVIPFSFEDLDSWFGYVCQFTR